jgi:four helix bundle protein
MEHEDLKERTQRFSVRIIKLAEHLPETRSSRIITGQILRSSSSIGANYRAARRSKSTRDFVNKLKIVEEETDETLYWLEIIEQAKIVDPDKLKDLIKEANELLSIFVTSIRTAKSNLAIKTKVRS